MDILAKAILHQKYKFECFDKRGRLKWEEEVENLVVTVGRNKYLDATLKTGLTSPAWYVGLKGAGTPAAADTMASHTSWAEITPYSNAARPAFTPGTIADGSVNNSGSRATFNVNAATTVYGGFMADDSTKAGTAGTLLGAADFASARAIESGDTLYVTITCSIAAA